MLSSNDILSLLPMMISAAGVIILLILIAIKRNHMLANLTAIITLVAAFISLFPISGLTTGKIGQLVIIDDYALFYMGLIFLASFVISLLSRPYLDKATEDIEEYYILLLLATLGSVTLVVSNHFVSFFIGLELLSTSLYVLIAFFRHREISTEAGIKYLVLAAVSSAFLLFGMALIYAETGTMYFPELAVKIPTLEKSLLTLGGLGFLIVGVGFKLALVPFHFWTPDVYEGAPAPVSALVATISKAGIFAVWLRFMNELNIYQVYPVLTVFAIIAAASMLAGNLLALFQQNIKRILAFSSIAHLGYLMVAFLTGGNIAIESTSFYIVAYMITMTGAFGTVTMLSGSEAEAGDLENYRGLMYKRPWIASGFTIMLMSLAGIPLTVGFISKFYILMSGAQAGNWWLLIILVISSTIGLFYYMRIILVMFSREKEKAPVIKAQGLSFTNGFILVLLTILLVGLGIYPSILLNVIKLFSLHM